MSKKKDVVVFYLFHFYLLVFLARAGSFSHSVDCIQSCLWWRSWPPPWRWRWARKGFFVIECSAHPSQDQVTTGYLRFSNPLSSITIQFCKSLCLMRANELCRISILSGVTWQFGVNSLTGTEDALRRPKTYANHPSHPIHPSHPHIASKMTSHILDDLSRPKMH